MENITTEAEFIEMLYKFFEIIKPNTDRISKNDCFCCKFGKQFSEEQEKEIEILGLMPDKETGERQHFFLGGIGMITKRAEFYLKNLLDINEFLDQEIEQIIKTESGIDFIINTRTKVQI